MQQLPHKSVLVNEVLKYLDPQPGKLYADVTFGIGGHTRAILQAEPRCSVVALDWDQKSLETYGVPLQEEFGDRLTLLWGNFALINRMLKKADITKVDGILADFGTSQVQLSQRAGFSFYHDTPLDMRMSPAHQRLTAAEVIRTSSYEKLCELFWQLGQEGRARAVARALVNERKKKPITTTGQLARIVEQALPEKRYYRIHPATKVFQALRIYVNKELENIQLFLAGSLRMLNSNSTIVCITFHSLEDRLVKQFFNDQERLGQLVVVTPKGVVATDQEVADNPSARSARLRAARYSMNSI